MSESPGEITVNAGTLVGIDDGIEVGTSSSVGIDDRTGAGAGKDVFGALHPDIRAALIGRESSAHAITENFGSAVILALLAPFIASCHITLYNLSRPHDACPHHPNPKAAILLLYSRRLLRPSTFRTAFV
ncbi:MAG: hypothetical protein JXB30_13555 [Anaerolineae bacterium]|nr:hypothetical protein [Anaerolineae bacterium]